jgi:hypothetical protein
MQKQGPAGTIEGHDLAIVAPHKLVRVVAIVNVMIKAAALMWMTGENEHSSNSAYPSAVPIACPIDMRLVPIITLCSKIICTHKKVSTAREPSMLQCTRLHPLVHEVCCATVEQRVPSKVAVGGAVTVVGPHGLIAQWVSGYLKHIE